MSHQLAWQVSLLLMTLVGFVFAFVAGTAGKREEDYAPLQKRAYRIRSRLFWALVLMFGPVMIYTLLDLPYVGARSSAAPAQVVKAVAHQWRWELSRDQVAAGEPVEFHVSSADVNHGFGLYDPDMRLVAQTQVMPGYTNTVRHTFNRQGTYKILCMEYCGIVHHNMMAEIRVGDPQERK
jgi:cytochrome c oxidase subunit 2